ASRLRRELDAAPERFAELAMRHSIDASASRGGLLAPISTVDPAYPLAMLKAIDGLVARAEADGARADGGDGEVSEVVAIDGGYALVQLVERLEGSVPADPVAARARMR